MLKQKEAQKSESANRFLREANYVDGKWISVDKFLTEHLHLKLTPATSVPGEPHSERE